MDLDVVLKSHDCPYIVQCFGTFITNVSPAGTGGATGVEVGIGVSVGRGQGAEMAVGEGSS